MFPTLLKQMPWAPQGLDKLGLWKSRIGGLPLVAIGGMTPERAVEALRAGAQSAAVVTDITLNADPEGRARQWVAATRAFRVGKKDANQQASSGPGSGAALPGGPRCPIPAMPISSPTR